MHVTFFSVGLARYPNNSSWDIPEAENSRAQVEKLFTRHAATAKDWTGSANSRDIGDFLETLRGGVEDCCIVYWVGHGEYSDDGYMAALADSTSPLSETRSLQDGDIFNTLRAWTRKHAGSERWLLLILDTCGSASGAWEVYRRFRQPPPNVAIIAGSEGADFAGRLADDLDLVLRGFTANDDAISLTELLRRLQDHFGDEPYKRVFGDFWSSARLAKRSDASPHVQATVDVYHEIEEFLQSAAPQARNHFYAKAQGAEIGELAWHFVGRKTERTEVSTWLREAEGGMFVISGLAGSGKSALLGMILATSDANFVTLLPDLGCEPVTDEMRPSGVNFDAVVHLTGRTVQEATTALSDGFDLDTGDDADALVAGLRSGDRGRLTVLVDALDESRDPLTIAATLRRLAAVPKVRVIVGTRQSMHEDPDHPIPTDSAILDALGPSEVRKLPRETDGVHRYVARRLNHPRQDTLTPPLALDSSTIDDLAAAIAARNQPFLFARLAVAEILAEPQLARDWARLARMLDGGHSGIFGHAVTRLRRDAPQVEALLHALAYSRGNGFPRTGGIWQIAASALIDAPLGDTKVRDILKLAAPFIMQDTEFGSTTYRLAHRTFAEWYLREDERSGRAGILRVQLTDRLLEHAEEEAAVDAGLSPYLRRYLTEHVGSDGEWHRLGQRLALLDNLDPNSVAFEATRTFFGRGSTPPATVLITMIAREELDSPSSEQRQLTRAISAALLGQTDVGLTSPLLRWSQVGRMVPHIRLTHSEGVVGVRFGPLPDGRIVLATSSRDNTIRLWDPTTGAVLGDPLAGPTSWDTLAFGALYDGRTLLASGNGHVVQLWDAATGEPLAEPLRHDAKISSVALGKLACGRALLAVGTSEGAVWLWDAATATPFAEPFRHSDGKRTSSVALVTLADGRTLLASAGVEGVQVWNVRTRSSLGDAVPANVMELAFGTLSDGRTLLAGAGGGPLVGGPQVWLWDAKTRKPFGAPLSLNKPRYRSDSMSSVAFGVLPGGRTLLASGGDDGVVGLWDPTAGTLVGEFAGHGSQVSSVAFGTLPDGRTLLASGVGLEVAARLWDPSNLSGNTKQTGEVLSNVICAANKDGSAVLVASRGRQLFLLDPDTGTRAREPLNVIGHVFASTFGMMPDGKLALAVSSYGKVQIWDATNWVPTMTLETGEQYIYSLALGTVHQNGRTLPVLATGSHGGLRDGSDRVQLWDASTGERFGRPVAENAGSPTSLAFGALPDGRTLLAGAVSALPHGYVQRWDAASGRSVGTRLGSDWPDSVAFGALASGRLLLAASSHRSTGDAVVNLWDAATGAQLGHFTIERTGTKNSSSGSTGTSVAIARLPDDRTVLACAAGGSVHLWRLDNSAVPMIAAYDLRPLQVRSLAIAEGSMYVGTDNGIVALSLSDCPKT